MFSFKFAPFGVLCLKRFAAAESSNGSALAAHPSPGPVRRRFRLSRGARHVGGVALQRRGIAALDGRAQNILSPLEKCVDIR